MYAIRSYYVQSLIRIGGWKQDATAHAADEVQLMLQGLVKAYVEKCEIHALSSTELVSHLNKQSALFQEKYGVELISLAIDSLEPRITSYNVCYTKLLRLKATCRHG